MFDIILKNSFYQKNDVIMCRTSKMHSVILYLAALRLGAIYVPLNPAYTVHELEHFMQNARPKLLISCQRNTDTALSELVSGPIVDEKLIAQQSSMVTASLDIEDVKEDDVAVILYTSGTTGKSITKLLLLFLPCNFKN